MPPHVCGDSCERRCWEGCCPSPFGGFEVFYGGWVGVSGCDFEGFVGNSVGEGKDGAIGGMVRHDASAA